MGCLLALLAWLRDEEPEPRASVRATKPRPAPTPQRGWPQKTYLFTLLRRDPLEWGSLSCKRWDLSLESRVPVENEGLAGRWATWASAWGRHRIPSRQWRGVLRGIGLSGEGLARWGGEISPWVAYVGLKTEEAWVWKDLSERYEEIDAIPEGEITEEERRELRMSASRELQRSQYELAEHLFDSDAPAIRSYAITLASDNPEQPPSKADLLDTSLDEIARLGVAQGLCWDPLDLDESEREQLFRQIQDASNGVWAVFGAQIGLWSALDSGALDEAVRWLDLLEEAQSFCLDWGHHGRFAGDPRLSSWEGLPANARPGGFEEAVASLAAASDATIRAMSCERVPCYARIAYSGDGRALYARLGETWGWEGFGYNLFGDDKGSYIDIVALSPDWGLSRHDRSSLAELALRRPRECLDRDDLSSIHAELDVILPSDRENDWATSLRRAIFSCHRDEEEGPFHEPIRADAYWNDGWLFFPGHPQLDCVAERALGPAPPPGLPVELVIHVRD